eukprot:COSAG05_NODE_1585_length_4485_cov_2.704514_5_plen_218_part_00
METDRTTARSRSSAADASDRQLSKEEWLPAARLESWRAVNFHPYQRWAWPQIPITQHTHSSLLLAGLGPTAATANSSSSSVSVLDMMVREMMVRVFLGGGGKSNSPPSPVDDDDDDDDDDKADGRGAGGGRQLGDDDDHVTSTDSASVQQWQKLQAFPWLVRRCVRACVYCTSNSQLRFKTENDLQFLRLIFPRNVCYRDSSRAGLRLLLLAWFPGR